MWLSVSCAFPCGVRSLPVTVECAAPGGRGRRWSPGRTCCRRRDLLSHHLHRVLAPQHGVQGGGEPLVVDCGGGLHVELPGTRHFGMDGKSENPCVLCSAPERASSLWFITKALRNPLADRRVAGSNLIGPHNL